MIQGPVRPIWVSKRPTFGGSISSERRLSRTLIDAWVRTSIRVAGKRDWVIVKVHTHDTDRAAAVLGDAMHHAFGHLETDYNNGSRLTDRRAARRPKPRLTRGLGGTEGAVSRTCGV